MKNTVAIVLAAGKGTRMKSEIPKVLHEILGKPMIEYVHDALKAAGIRDIITVAGHGSHLLRERVTGSRIVIQNPLLGSGDAVNTALRALARFSGDIVVICGDTPLIRSSTIRALLGRHRRSGASLTLLTAELGNPAGYGRIVRDARGSVSKIVEEENADIYEKAIEEVNVGTYCFRSKDLLGAMGKVKVDARKKEIFLTDTISVLRNSGKAVESVKMDDPSEMVGINSRKSLAEATATMRTRIMDDVMAAGVTIEDPRSTTIYHGVKIGRDTVIHPDTYIQSDVEIGRRCAIGPFARLRPGVRIADDVEIGNFVELVRTSVGRNSKVKHHTYLGDTTVGAGANIGAGTITANYDGRSKNRTVIGDRAFIGVGAILIAPVKIGKRAVVGAGCVVPKKRDVPDAATVVGVPARILRKRQSRI